MLLPAHLTECAAEPSKTYTNLTSLSSRPLDVSSYVIRILNVFIYEFELAMTWRTKPIFEGILILEIQLSSFVSDIFKVEDIDINHVIHDSNFPDMTQETTTFPSTRI